MLLFNLLFPYIKAILNYLCFLEWYFGSMMISGRVYFTSFDLTTWVKWTKKLRKTYNQKKSFAGWNFGENGLKVGCNFFFLVSISYRSITDPYLYIQRTNWTNWLLPKLAVITEIGCYRTVLGHNRPYPIHAHPYIARSRPIVSIKM